MHTTTDRRVGGPDIAGQFYELLRYSFFSHILVLRVHCPEAVNGIHKQCTRIARWN